MLCRCCCSSGTSRRTRATTTTSVDAPETRCARLQAADSGWGHGEKDLIGMNALDLSRVPGEQRRTQAWLYASLNGSCLAQRLQTLVALRKVLDDWYFPWALLRQEDRLTDFLTELVKVRLRWRAALCCCAFQWKTWCRASCEVLGTVVEGTRNAGGRQRKKCKPSCVPLVSHMHLHVAATSMAA